jgi:hypothetical protein
VSFVPQARHPALFYYVPETADFRMFMLEKTVLTHQVVARG